MRSRRGLGQTARRLLLLPGAGWAVLAAAGYAPTRSLAGGTGIEAMFTAQALIVAVVYVTLVPTMRQMVSGDAARRFRLALKAGMIRLIITVPLVAITAWRGGVEPAAFLIWAAIAYALMIQLETMTLVYWSRRLEDQP